MDLQVLIKNHRALMKLTNLYLEIEIYLEI